MLLLNISYLYISFLLIKFGKARQFMREAQHLAIGHFDNLGTGFLSFLLNVLSLVFPERVQSHINMSGFFNVKTCHFLFSLLFHVFISYARVIQDLSSFRLLHPLSVIRYLYL